MSTPQNILRIDASGRKQGSLSRQLTEKIVAQTGATNPSVEVVHRDLADSDIPFVDETWIGANFTDQAERTETQKEALGSSDVLVAELQNADTIVIGTPIYNFGIPASLKAYIDMVTRARVTFRYTDDGPVGLLEGKRAIVAVASGGVELGSDYDFASNYIRFVLGFIGIKDVTFVDATGTAKGADAALARANGQIEALAL